MELNKIYHMDCIEGMKLLENNSIDLILTDIPYGVVSRESNGIRNLDKGSSDVETFELEEFLKECNRVCKGNIYIFCSSEQVSFIRSKLIEYKLTTRHCIWEKTNPSPMNGQHLWLSSIENCIYAKNRGSVHNEHCKGGVWKFPNGSSKIHPTQKPIKLFDYLVRVSSNEGMLILDPCIGSGTTAIAAMMNDRKFIGFEKDKEYFDICEKRIGEYIENLNS